MFLRRGFCGKPSINEVGSLKKQQRLQVCLLDEPVKQAKELLLLRRRETRPMLPQRFTAHRITVQKLAEQDRERGQLFDCGSGCWQLSSALAGGSCACNR